MRSVRLASLVAATGMLAATVPAGVAAAAPEPQRWAQARCVQATLSTVTYEAAIHYFTVGGTATQCEASTATTAPTGFGAATFSSSGNAGHVWDWAIRLFPAPATPWQPVTVDFGVAAVPATAGRRPVCVARYQPPPAGSPIWTPGRSVPVACLQVTVTVPEEGEPTAVAAPLPVEAVNSRVTIQVPATFTGATVPHRTPEEDDDNEGGGNCGTCF